MKTRLLSFTVLAALLLPACIESTNTVRVAEDGSGSIEIVRLISKDFADNFVSDGGSQLQPAEPDINNLCERMRSPELYSEGATVEPVDNNTACGVKVALQVSSEENFAARLAELDKGTFGPLSDFFDIPDESEYVVEMQDDQWIFKLPTPTVVRLSSDFVDPADAQAVLSKATFSYTVTLPGTAIAEKTNADSVDGGTFTWDVDVTNPPEILEARTTPPAQGFFEKFGTYILIGLAVLTLLVALLFVLRKLKGRKNSATSEDGSSQLSKRSNTESQDNSPTVPDGEQPTATRNEEDTNQKDEDPTPSPSDVMPNLDTLPLGASKPRWNEDYEMWMSDHETSGSLFFDSETGKWAKLR